VRIRKRLLLLAACAAAVSAAAVTSAVASPPQAISGNVTYLSSSFNDITFEGGNLIIDLSATVAYTGTFTGTSTLHGTLILHPDGTSNAHDVEVFTGTVDGVPGTVTFNLNVQGDPSLKVRGTDVITNATGGLVGLHGMLTIDAQVYDKLVGPVGTYGGQIEGLDS
jgi:nitrous oxidase accessory protein NosD